MLRISLFAASLSACAFNDQGQLILCTENDCVTDTTEPSGPVPPPNPVSFVFEDGDHHSFPAGPTLARGGVLHLDAVSTSAQLPAVSFTGSLELELLSAGAHLTTVEVGGPVVGAGVISAEIPGFAAVTLDVRVKELANLEIGLPYHAETLADHIVVLADIRTLELSPTSEDGTPVLDHSFALANPPAGFTLVTWDALAIPQTAGDYRLGLTRAAGDVHEVGVRVVDHVDDIVAVDFADAGAQAGTLCVKAVVGAEQVQTRAWTFAGAGLEVIPLDYAPNCADFIQATPGSTITVELAGTTKTFQIR